MRKGRSMEPLSCRHIELETKMEPEVIITGFDITYDPLRYIVGTVSDHILTLGGEEISLRDMCGRNARVAFEIVTGFEILTKGMK